MPITLGKEFRNEMHHPRLFGPDRMSHLLIVLVNCSCSVEAITGEQARVSGCCKAEDFNPRVQSACVHNVMSPSL